MLAYTLSVISAWFSWLVLNNAYSEWRRGLLGVTEVKRINLRFAACCLMGRRGLWWKQFSFMWEVGHNLNWCLKDTRWRQKEMKQIHICVPFNSLPILLPAGLRPECWKNYDIMIFSVYGLFYGYNFVSSLFTVQRKLFFMSIKVKLELNATKRTLLNSSISCSFYVLYMVLHLISL